MRSLFARFAFAALLVVPFLGLQRSSGLSAQVVEYLKPIGGSDVELFFQLEMIPNAGGLRSDGEKIQIQADGAEVSYTLARGRVTNVAYQKIYPDQSSSEVALLQARKFMEAQGIEVKDIVESTVRSVASGSGNGFHGSLLLVPVGNGGYRLDAEIFAKRE